MHVAWQGDVPIVTEIQVMGDGQPGIVVQSKDESLRLMWARIQELEDLGCEFCDAMITDRLDLPDDPEFNGQLAHAWACIGCWNKQWQEHQTRCHGEAHNASNL